MRKNYKNLLLLFLIHFVSVLYANPEKYNLKISSIENEVIENRAVNMLLPPTATISGTTTVCQNDSRPQITFTGSGGTAPYTFTYTVTGITGNQTITTTSGSSKTIPVPTTAAGVFTYNLISVHDSTSPTLEQNTPDVATITVSSPPAIDFTFNNDNTCSGTAIQFSSSITGAGTYIYSWNFGDGTTSSQPDPTHSFNSLGCGTATFDVTLTVTGDGCVITKTKTITIKQRPDIDFEDINATSLAKQFNNCANASSNAVYTINVGNVSKSTCITNYSINWGDGTSQTNVLFPTSHTYSTIGVYSMIITANGNNGCNNSMTYVVKNVSNPLGGLNSPGSTQDLCAPTAELQFSISNWGVNSVDTKYSIDYGDGTPILILNQSQLNSSIYYNATSPSNSANFPIPHAYTKSNCPSNSFEVKLVVTNACGSTPFTLGNITILTKPQVNFSGPSTACIITNVKFTNTTIPGSDSGCLGSTKYIWNFGDPASGSSNVVTTSFTNTIPDGNHTFSSPGTYSVTLTAQNSCGTSVKTEQICIEPALVPAFTIPPSAACSPQSITATNTTSTVGACTTPTYKWNVTYTAANCGTTPATWTYTGGTSATSVSPSFNFVTAGTYSITLAATNSCGTVTSPAQTITIKKPPTISINTIAPACGATTITPTAMVNSCAPASSTLQYAWSFPGGSPASATTANPGTITYSTTGNYTVSLSVTNECGTVTTDQNIILKPIPTVANSPLTQTICSGSATTQVQLTSTPIGATYTWTATATSGITGFTTSGTGTIPAQTITTTNTNPGTLTYKIAPSLNGCIGTPTDYVITVNPAPTIIVQPTASTICLGGTLTALSFTISGSTGTPTYQWFSNNANNNTSGTALSGETNPTFSPPTTALGTVYYYCEITFTSGGCSLIKTNPTAVTIRPNITVTTQPTPTQNLCVGVTIPTALTVSITGGTGTFSYQWYSSTNNSNTGGTVIPSATTAIYTPPAFNTEGIYYFYVMVSSNGNGCTPITSNVAEINVYADPTLSTQPIVLQSLCQGAVPANLEVVATGGNGLYSYQWYSHTTNFNSGGTIISGATSATYTPLTTTVGTKYYYAIIKQTTLGCQVNSAVASVTIITAPTITSQPSSSTVCQGGSPTALSVSYANGVGTPTYQWFMNTSNTTTNATPILGATNASFTPTASSVGITYYYCLITLPSGGCSSLTSNIAAVTVTNGITISNQPAPTQNLCVGGTIPTPLSITTIGGTGTFSYQWYSNTTNSNAGGSAISSATNASYTPAVFTTAGNYYYYVMVSPNGSGCDPILSSTAEIIVVNDPIVSTQPLTTQSLCQGSIPTVLSVATTGGLGTVSYQWYSNSSNSNSGGVAITSETNPTFAPPTSTVTTSYYYATIIQPGIACATKSNVAQVIVNLAPSLLAQPQSRTACLGQTLPALSVTYQNGAGTPTYQWFSNTSNSTTGGIALSGATNTTYTPLSTALGTLYYYCEITFATAGCSFLISNAAAIAILPYPVITNKSVTICSGSNFAIIPDNLSRDTVPLGTMYTWTTPISSPAGIVIGALAQNTPTSTIQQTLINSSLSPAMVTYTITPISGICSGTPFSILVTVNPSITTTNTQINSSCYGANNGAIQVNATGGIPFISGANYLYSWSGPNGFTSSLNAISNLAPGNYALSITDNGGCPITKDYTVTEPNDIIITTDISKNSSCFNANDGQIAITVSGGTLNYSYNWTKDGLTFSTNEDLSNLAYGNYTVSVVDAKNCGPKTASFTISQPQLLVVSIAAKTDVLCFGDATGAIATSVTGGTAPYQYIWTGPNGFSSSLPNLTAIAAGTYNLSLKDDLGCQQTLSVTLTQPTAITISVTTTPIICYENNDASISIAVSGGIAPYNIVWNTLATGNYQDNLSPGDYTVTITDASNCTKNLTINIADAPVYKIEPVVKNIRCFGEQNGSINLNLVGGIAPIKITWDDNATAGTIRNNLRAGRYTVTIVDSKPCTITRTFYIIEPQALAASGNVMNALDCTNVNSGAIELIVTGGTAPYTYNWSNGAITKDLVNTPAGNYLVTVVDSNGCSTDAFFSINRPPAIVTKVVTKTDFDCDSKYIKQNFVAQVTGGVPPYQLVWSSGTVSGPNNEIMNTSQNGSVILNVTDAVGCKSDYSFNVELQNLGTPTYSTSSYASSTYGNYSINDPIEFTNTSDGDFVSMIWDFGDGTFSNEINPIHTFTIAKDYVVTQTVTYPFGCVYVNKATLTIGKGYMLIVPTAFTPNEDSLNDTFRPVTKGLKNIRLDIYDTWGSLIYSETADVIKGWDALIKGYKAENGNYFCKVSGQTFYGTIVNENHPFVLIK
ncbi:PKD domain-containing protein [Flavobacterium algicola]|uniref:PKD domain-containing protein n=1 Tax=Flavobacterium algicola TaxID=556529 RepID=UPI001EFE2785|nr:PKD domain-containing protein [Flavobacterium algicola]MCG9793391.1 PKD domain-containing protein [Flavobacterium algicola]